MALVAKVGVLSGLFMMRLRITIFQIVLMSITLEKTPHLEVTRTMRFSVEDLA
jgi:hypothetical protein